jgi:hypothetical protein
VVLGHGLHHAVGERLEVVRGGLQMVGECAEPVFRVVVAGLDQPVGEQGEDGAGRQRHRGRRELPILHPQGCRDREVEGAGDPGGTAAGRPEDDQEWGEVSGVRDGQVSGGLVVEAVQAGHQGRLVELRDQPVQQRQDLAGVQPSCA